MNSLAHHIAACIQASLTFMVSIPIVCYSHCGRNLKSQPGCLLLRVRCCDNICNTIPGSFHSSSAVICHVPTPSPSKQIFTKCLNGWTLAKKAPWNYSQWQARWNVSITNSSNYFSIEAGARRDFVHHYSWYSRHSCLQFGSAERNNSLFHWQERTSKN